MNTKLIELLGEYKDCNQLLQEYCEDQLHRISENKPVQHFDDDLICFKNVLKALSEIFNVQTEIFQRDFSSDDEYLRLQRLQAAANAQQTAKLYEANKIQKYASTGMQIGSIILMILALIL